MISGTAFRPAPSAPSSKRTGTDTYLRGPRMVACWWCSAHAHTLRPHGKAARVGGRHQAWECANHGRFVAEGRDRVNRERGIGRAATAMMETHEEIQRSAARPVRVSESRQYPCWKFCFWSQRSVRCFLELPADRL